jgi:hypothetical protein
VRHTARHLRRLRHSASCGVCGAVVVLFGTYNGGEVRAHNIDLVLVRPYDARVVACTWCNVSPARLT